MYESINYLEYPARDLEATKRFFRSVFGWKFIDYGPDYVAFSEARFEGGFYRADKCCLAEQGGALTVFLSQDLAASQARIEAAGGVISTPTFSFPGGQRFHFTEPSGNEFAVWQQDGSSVE